MKIIYGRVAMEVIMEFINNTGGSRAAARGSLLFLVVGWISAIISLVRYPFIFGVVGVVMGILATKKGSRAGLALIMTSIILMAIGLIFGGVFFNYLSHYLGI